MNVPTTTAPADSQSQEIGSPGLDTAMDSWGDGEQSGQAPAQQTTPEQQEPTTTQSAPATATRPTPAQVATATTPATPPQDSAALVRAAVEATATAMANQSRTAAAAPAQPKTMTDEEFAARYGITNYDAKYIERLFDKDPAKAAQVLNEIQRNAYLVAVRMANDLISAQLAQTQDKFSPRIAQVEKFIAEQNERQATDRFYRAYPALAPEADLVKEVLDATQAKIARGELKFTTEQQAFQYVADATNRVVSRMSSSTAGKTGVQQTPNGTRQMATATSAARPGGQSTKKTDLDSVMDSWDQAPE